MKEIIEKLRKAIKEYTTDDDSADRIVIIRICRYVVELEDELKELRKRRNEAMKIAQKYKEKYETLRDDQRVEKKRELSDSTLND